MGVPLHSIKAKERGFTQILLLLDTTIKVKFLANCLENDFCLQEGVGYN